MLRSLFVRNIAVIEEAGIELDPGLTILTGETGAGKSVLVGALQLLLGERASSDLVRTGRDRARVEARFELPAGHAVLQRLGELGIESDDGNIIIRREVGADGRSRAFINDRSVTVGALREIGDELVDLHGQHEHQSLLRAAQHVLLLDAWAGLDPLRLHYARLLARYRDTDRTVREIREAERALAETRELHTFQLAEIDVLDPRTGEVDELEQEVKILENAERIAAELHSLIALLSEDDTPLLDSVLAQSRRLAGLAALDPRLEEPRALIEEARLALEEAVHSARHYLDGFDFDQERCDRARERLSALIGLVRKYGGNEAALLQKREDLRNRLRRGRTVRADLAAREEELRAVRTELSETAVGLSRRRGEACPQLETAIEAELATLAMPGARFRISSEQRRTDDGLVDTGEGGCCEAGPHGIDRVEFLLATDPAAPLLPLQKVASGGEVSRIMLALKSVFGAASHVPTLVFDEIDNGIGGRTADRVGEKLEALSGAHQVLAVTHLPQIARRGRRHLLVEKSLADDGARVGIRTITGPERTEVLAVLMSGGAGGDDGLDHARRLLEEREGEDRSG